MTEEVVAFLLALSQDPERRAAFALNYEVALAAQPLSPEAKAFLATWTEKQLIERAGALTADYPPQYDSSPNITTTHDAPPDTWVLPNPASTAFEPTGKKLVLVGLGVQIGTQLTLEARNWIERADKVFYVVTNDVAAQYVRQLQPNAESLSYLYSEDLPRTDTYTEMANRVIDAMSTHSTVCMAFYGHPGVLVDPTRQAADRARLDGHQVISLPGISALACMFTDLGLDPGATGLQMYEATDFMVCPRDVDIKTPLVLWQAGSVGHPGWHPNGDHEQNVPRLVAHLDKLYKHKKVQHPEEIKVGIYQASPMAPAPPILRHTTLGDLAKHRLTAASLLVIPPIEPRKVNKKTWKELQEGLKEPKEPTEVD